MKKLIVLIAVFVLLSVPAFAQDETRFGAFGLGISQDVDGSVLGWGALGMPITDKVINFTSFNVFAADKVISSEFSILGRKLQYTIRTGAAYRFFDFGSRVSVWGLGDIGLATDGEVITGSYAGGGFINIKLNDKWGIMAIMQADHDQINGTDFKPLFGANARF